MKPAYLFRTVASLGPTLLRLGLAEVMFPHGAQKVFGLFGGPGFSGAMGSFTNILHLPVWLAALAILTEFFAPVALFLGFFTRLAALALAVHMTVAAILGGHTANGMFMNWMGNQKGEGFEFHILIVAMSLALVLMGGGRAALDSWIARNMGVKSPVSIGRPE